MEKETNPSSCFVADFLTRVQAVCGGTADAARLCEAGGAGSDAGSGARSGGCAGPRCWVSAGDTGAKGARRGRALGRGKQGMGTRGGWPWACHACSSTHIDLPEEDAVPAEPRHPVSRPLDPCPQPEPPRRQRRHSRGLRVPSFPLPPSSSLHGPGVVSHYAGMRSSPLGPTGGGLHVPPSSPAPRSPRGSPPSVQRCHRALSPQKEVLEWLFPSPK